MYLYPERTMVSGTRDLFRPESIYFLLIFLFSFLRVLLLFPASGSGSDGERLSRYYLVRVPGSAYVLYGSNMHMHDWTNFELLPNETNPLLVRFLYVSRFDLNKSNFFVGESLPWFVLLATKGRVYKSVRIKLCEWFVSKIKMEIFILTTLQLNIHAFYYAH